MPDKNLQKEMQQKYMELTYMKQHIEEYNKHLKELESQCEEIDRIIDGLKSISKSESGKEMLVPVSNGIFAKAKLADNASLIVNVGSDIAVKKDIPGTIELLDRQKAEIESGKQQIGMIAESISEQMSAVENDLQQMMEKQ